MTDEQRPVVADVRGLEVHFPVWRNGRRMVARAVDGVDLVLHEREIVALVGESGCGKTTIARTVMRLENATAGTVHIDGVEVTRLSGARLRRLRDRFQMIFQDPFDSLPANATALEVIEDGLRIHRRDLSASDRKRAALDALASCGLNPPERFANRRVFQLSGGQRQRVAIAAVLVLEPRLIVADEPVSMLDVSLRAGVIRLLLDLRERTGNATLFITHDLALAGVFADRVAVLYLGKIVEEGPAAAVIGAPAHPYTRALVDVMPVPEGMRDGPRSILTGDTPSATEVPVGCRFAPRCPLFRQLGEPARCRSEQPELEPVTGDIRHRIACHFSARGDDRPLSAEREST
jgi:oligopeptide/dipeptide ABC transporter ATP-binding protein